MSKIAIWEGLGRRRRSKSYGYRYKLPKAPPGRHWHANKNRKASTPAMKKAQARFKTAAKACKVEFRRKGGIKQRRRAFNMCIKAKLAK